MNQNIILIGGPIPNSVTRYMLNQPEIRYKFGEHPGPMDHVIIDKSNKEIKFEALSIDGKIEKDYAIITRMKNPYNRQKDCIIVSGCYGYGTFEGIKAVMNTTCLEYLNDFAYYFQAICTCEIAGNAISDPYFIDRIPDQSKKPHTITSIY